MTAKGYRMENLSAGYGSRVVISGVTATVLPGAILILLIFGTYGPGYDSGSFIYEQF